MASFVEKENKVLKEKVYEMEISLKEQKEKYVKVFYENHANFVRAKELKQKIKKFEEENKFLQAEIDVLLGKDNYFSASQKRDLDLLKDNYRLTSRIYELEKTLESERKESEEERVKQIKEKYELTKKVNKVENELNDESNLHGKENDILIEIDKRFDAERKHLAIERIKQLADVMPPLKIPTVSDKRVLQTDASDDYWGAVIIVQNKAGV
ncbi:golgin subfamily A member 6-like protein 4 [Cynara cardunculus var. scolymus]|uniref:golgin subfamily A member 6-like protein 4 n=1 Tax=Cynara cardunculus var. scolymus TaxID=59895 RepID=UPI000D62A54D|nr:golgin subfamily A member 6-like protein 4 [Cynara cardunculus var. scolymus]